MGERGCRSETHMNVSNLSNLSNVTHLNVSNMSNVTHLHDAHRSCVARSAGRWGEGGQW